MKLDSARHQGPDDRGASLPMTSLIDVVFLLLIFFMVTTTLAPSESQLSSTLKTERKEGGSAADFQPQVVNVEPGGEGRAQFRIGERIVTSGDALRDILAQLPKEAGVFVRVMDDVRVGDVADAIQASKDAGFTKVSYVAPE